jgi:hypothetical protein
VLAEVEFEVVVLLAAFFHEPLDAGCDFGPGEGFQEPGVGGFLITSDGYVAAGVEDSLAVLVASRSKLATRVANLSVKASSSASGTARLIQP